MSDAAFWVEGFSTGYRIGPRERYEALRDIITDAFVAPFRRLRENPQSAIRNVSPAAFCLLPSAVCLLVFRNSPFEIRNVSPAAYCLLPSAYCLLRL